jgi:hypothetical protein
MAAGGRDRRAERWLRVRKTPDVGGVLDGCGQCPLDAVSVQMPPVIATHVQGALTRTRSWPGAVPDRVTIWEQIFGTNGRAEDNHNRGVSDPAGGPGAAFAVHERGRSRPVSCPDTTAWA